MTAIEFITLIIEADNKEEMIRLLNEYRVPENESKYC